MPTIDVSLLAALFVLMLFVVVLGAFVVVVIRIALRPLRRKDEREEQANG